MKRLLSILLLLGFCFSNLQTAKAMEPKLKILGSMAVYGTVGGSLLGVATLAFGGEGRNVAKGASLGLYAGLLFGSYVILSHMARQNNWGGGDGYGGYEEPAYDDTAAERRVRVPVDSLERYQMERARRHPTYFFDLLSVSF